MHNEASWLMLQCNARALKHRTIRVGLGSYFRLDNCDQPIFFVVVYMPEKHRVGPILFNGLRFGVFNLVRRARIYLIHSNNSKNKRVNTKINTRPKDRIL